MARLEVGPYDILKTLKLDKDDMFYATAPQRMQAKVTLSRRNLLALLHKLDMPGSARRLENNCVYIEGEVTDHLMLVLCCEDDSEHYADERRQGSRPGVMHPDSETFIQGSKSPAGL